MTDTHDPNTGLLRNSYTRKQFYKKNFNYIEPKEIDLHDEKGKITDCKYSYVPILKTLEHMLANENVKKYCTENHSDNNIIMVYSILKMETFIQITCFFKVK